MVVKEADVADQHCGASSDSAGSPTLVFLPFLRSPCPGADWQYQGGGIHWPSKGGARSCTAQEEAMLNLCWAGLHIPSLSTVHGPAVENWQADFACCQPLNPGVWVLPLTVFAEICLWCRTPDVDLTAFKFHIKREKFVSQIKAPPVFEVATPGESLRSVFLWLCPHCSFFLACHAG